MPFFESREHKRNRFAQQAGDYLTAGEYTKSLAAADQAIRVDPSQVRSYNVKCVALMRLGRDHDALAVADQAIRVDPSESMAYSNRAAALSLLGRSADSTTRTWYYEQAIAAADQAIRLNPSNIYAYTTKGGSLERIDRYQEALDTLDLGIRRTTPIAETYEVKGDTLNNMGRYREALIALNEAIHLNPALPSAHAEKGYTLIQLGRFDEALPELNTALRLDPSLPFVHYWIDYVEETSEEDVDDVLDDLNDALKPQIFSLPLTEERVREIVNETIEVHPTILRLEREGVQKWQIAELVEAVLESRQSIPGRRRGHGLSDSQLDQTVKRVAGDNPAARSAIQKFIDERVKTATDPERVLSAFLAIVGGFVPGAAQAVAVIQAINILFSKKVIVEDTDFPRR
jgi:tetratricopeptide (TPR) repeat protein